MRHNDPAAGWSIQTWLKKLWVGYLNEVEFKPGFNESSDLQISSLVRYFVKKINPFLVYSICFHKTVHNKRCLDKTVGQIEKWLRTQFCKTLAKLRLNNWPYVSQDS